MKYLYHGVYEYYEEPNQEKRRIYTFDNEMAAHDMVEFILKNDMKANIGVEEIVHESTT